MTDVAFQLSEEQAQRLDAIARHRHASTAAVVQEAVTQYLDHDADFCDAVQQGIDEADRGDTEDFGTFAVELRVEMAARAAAAAE